MSAVKKLLHVAFYEYSDNDNYDYLLADEDLNKEERRIKYADCKKKAKEGHRATNRVAVSPFAQARDAA
jgi:hypothetical protein